MTSASAGLHSASMLEDRCPGCETRMVYAKADLLDLGGPLVTIVDVPALKCGQCGTWFMAGNVHKRLDVILATALEHARSHRVDTLEWSFTPSGPAEIGGLPCDVRDLFGRIATLNRHEREIMHALRRNGDEPPRSFH